MGCVLACLLPLITKRSLCWIISGYELRWEALEIPINLSSSGYDTWHSVSCVTRTETNTHTRADRSRHADKSTEKQHRQCNHKHYTISQTCIKMSNLLYCTPAIWFTCSCPIPQSTESSRRSNWCFWDGVRNIYAMAMLPCVFGHTRTWKLQSSLYGNAQQCMKFAISSLLMFLMHD